MSDLVGNPEDRFSHNEAHLWSVFHAFLLPGQASRLKGSATTEKPSAVVEGSRVEPPVEPPDTGQEEEEEESEGGGGWDDEDWGDIDVRNMSNTTIHTYLSDRLVWANGVYPDRSAPLGIHNNELKHHRQNSISEDIDHTAHQLCPRNVL